MQNYKAMYLKIVRASEQAINTLIQAQRECEELYMSQSEPDLKVISYQQRTRKAWRRSDLVLHNVPSFEGKEKYRELLKSTFFKTHSQHLLKKSQQ